ncbi:MAG: MlaD family protein [Aeromicrobium erythreum]
MSRPMAMRHRTAAFGLAATLVAVSAYLYAGVLGGSLGERPESVRVELARTGGLFEGSNVAYRGVTVGSVESVRPARRGAVATISLDRGTDVPRDTDAVVRSLSPAGEQFLDLQPRSARGPYLRDGDVIRSARTSTPTTVAETVRAVDALMDDVDEDDLRTTLDELGTAFSDPDDLARVLDASTRILQTLDDLWPETERILDNGRTVLQTGVAVEDDLREFSTSAKSLAAWLRDYDPTLRDQLSTLPAGTEQVRRLVSLFALKLPAVLDEVLVFTDVVVPRREALSELLRVFPMGFDRFSDAVKNGRLRTNMLVSNGEVCSYGAGRPLPSDTKRPSVPDDRSCPSSFPGQQRGSINAPRPLPSGR